MDTNKYLDDKGLECLVGNIKKGLAEKQPKGDYATLVGGKLMTWVLPADVDEVLKFSGTVDEVSVALQSLGSWKAIVFHKTEKRFYATKLDYEGKLPGYHFKPALLRQNLYRHRVEQAIYMERRTVFFDRFRLGTGAYRHHCISRQ